MGTAGTGPHPGVTPLCPPKAEPGGPQKGMRVLLVQGGVRGYRGDPKTSPKCCIKGVPAPPIIEQSHPLKRVWGHQDPPPK